MDTWNQIENALCELEDRVEEALTPVNASECGLDPRCGPLFRGQDFLATRNRSSLDYYGGFEYVDSEYIRSVGHWTLYSSEHDRIACALETWETHPNRAEE